MMVSGKKKWQAQNMIANLHAPFIDILYMVFSKARTSTLARTSRLPKLYQYLAHASYTTMLCRENIVLLPS